MEDLVATLGRLDHRARASLRELLVAATATPTHSGHGDALQELARSAPVDLLPAAATHHRVAGSVLDGIASVDGIPDAVRNELAQERDQASLHHLVTVGALSEVATRFDDAELDWLVMKGPTLAALLYPHVGDRRYGDLDLLVERRDFPAAVRALEGLGYEHSIKNWALAEKSLAGQISLTNATTSIDLHWHLHYSADDRAQFAIDPASMLARAGRRRVSGVDVPVFDPVDTVVSLGFHAARSGGHRLIWMKDLERAMTVLAPDSDAVARRADEFGCGPSVGLMLERARRLLGAPVSPRLTRALASPALLASDQVACALQHPIRFDERPTMPSSLVRSVRRSAVASLSDTPGRAGRWVRSKLLRDVANETDDPNEKLRYFSAVATSGDRQGNS